MKIRDIKSHLNILTVLSHYHLQPNKNSLIKCPFHDDKDPSLKVYTNTNTFNCFGCGKFSFYGSPLTTREESLPRS